jgi:orotate phosphoribosyltransferase
MYYVRKKPKGFGRDAQIEGDSVLSKRILLVEDLTTDGGSKIKFADALREAGASVTDTLVVFYYDIFPETKLKLKDHGLALHHLATWWDVLSAARAGKHFDAKTLDEVEQFLNEPLSWSAAHGGISEMSI